MDDLNYLSHHGILGQKWGVRRYQNKDGSLTEAGRKRLQNGESYRGGNGGSKAKTAAKVAAVAAGVAIAAWAINDPSVREYVSAFVDAHKDTSIEALKKVGKGVSSRLVKAGDAAVNAAIASAGAIAVSKLADRMAPTEQDSEAQKNAKKIALDAATASILSATGNVKTSSGSSKGGSVGKEVSSIVGPPSNKGIDKSGSSYQALFKTSDGSQRDQETRSTIKSMASAGYDIEQIQRYLNTIRHSGMLFSINNVSKTNYYRLVY